MPMTNLLSLFLGAVLATNPVEAASNLLTGKAVSASPGVAIDPVEEAYQKILEFDDSSDTDIEKWIADAAKFAEAGAGADSATLKAKVEQRIAEVDKAYRTFVEQHPNHARARIAYGSYLNDNRDEPGAVKQWEEAKRIDPKLPAVWNNLANYYGHRGPVTNAFVHYQKAMDLMPNEAIYPWNYATTVYLFRKDAMEFFSISESDVFERALGLYRLAIKLDPANMPAGLSANQVQMPANNMNMPPGISVNAVNMPIGNKPIPGIPSAEQLKKGFKPGKMPTPGIPDQETIRRQMSMPAANAPVPPPNSIPMMKNKRLMGGKPQ